MNEVKVLGYTLPVLAWVLFKYLTTANAVVYNQYDMLQKKS